MKKRLSRKRTRAAIVLLCLGLILFLLEFIVHSGLFETLGILVFVVGLLALQWKCPHCGRFIKPSMQWSGPSHCHCDRCDQDIFYNDETVE